MDTIRLGSRLTNGLAQRLIASFFALVLCVTASPAQAVVFGEEVSDASASYPWVASIWWDANATSTDVAEQVCTGSLIETDIILTAAHCVKPTGQYLVKLGASFLTGAGEIIEVSATWINPRYSDSKLVNDIALLKLSKPASIKPVRYALGKHSKQIAKLSQYRIFGWGVNQNLEDATYLRTAVLDQKNAQAAKAFGASFNVKTMIGAGKYISSEKVYAGACYGDSGGPLIGTVSNVKMVVGITSYGKSGCNVNAPSVFTRLSYYENDLISGLQLVRLNELTQNRSLPKPEVEPSITGNLVRGGTATCNPGVWSTGTTSLTFRWISPYTLQGSNRPTVDISGWDVNVYSDTKFTCRIIAANASGTVVKEVTFTLPPKPYFRSYPGISGLPFFSTPVIGTVATCGGFRADSDNVTSSVAWYMSPDYKGTTTKVGSSYTLTIDASMLALAKTHWYLTCEVVISNSGGTSTEYSPSVYLRM